MTTTRPDTAGWRPAGVDDVPALARLERDANRAGLVDVFADLPFPDDAVLESWRATLVEDGVTVDVVDASDGLIAYVAFDADRLRHLAVHPSAWGRGLGRAGVARAVSGGATRLWVLEANHRARGLYESLGWRPTGLSQACRWEPHPVELEYAVG